MFVCASKFFLLQARCAESFALFGTFTLEIVFFFKQKTAYEVRISDWSSDVCSSDLRCGREHFRDVFREAGASGALAASIFHDGRVAIPELKEYLASCGIEVRR